MHEAGSSPTVSAGATISIRAEKLSRHYQMGSSVIRAVEEVDLEVAKGEFAALLGPSGSGKSSLLHMVAGMDHPTSGSLTVEGRELRGLTSEELAQYRRHTIGMVFQAFNLMPSLDVFNNVEMPLRLAEVDRDARHERVRKALEQVGLGGRMQHRPSELSGGEQQRVALARALVNNPSLLLADEPTGNLDSKTGEEIMQLMQECNQSLGMTVVLVTHERQLADQFARRLIFMADGKILPQNGKPQ